jgi:signal transduction histidine kinase
MLATVTWLVRAGAVVLIGLETFVGRTAHGRDLVFEIVAYVIGTVLLVLWYALNRKDNPAYGRVMALGYAVMAVTSGLTCTAPDGGALIGFCIIAALAAGTDIASTSGWVVLGVDVLAVEIGAVVSGAGTTRSVGYPLILVVSFIAGRNRRASLVQAEQSAAMIAQLQQLRAEQAQVAVLDERTRIAREIHDVLAHSLGALGIQIQAVRAVLTEHGDIDRALGLLEQSQRMATDGLVDTRRAVQALRGDTTRLDLQLTALAESHRGMHGSLVALTVDGTPRTLTPEATVALVRTAQEALVNTAKHAPLQPVQLRLTYADDEVSLVVVNELPQNGQAGTTFSSVDGGYGLTGMRERLLLIRGSLTTGADDRRWTVAARVPQ